MKLAIPCDKHNHVVLHLNDAAYYMLYDCMDDEICSEERAEFSPEQSAEALAAFLLSRQVSVLICGLLPVSTLPKLQQAGIQVLGGAAGQAVDRVNEFLGGALHFDLGFVPDNRGEEPECDGNLSACGHWCH